MPRSRFETETERAERYLRVLQGLKLTLKGHDEYTDRLVAELERALAQPRHYAHQFSLAFSVRSPNPADRITRDELRGALMERVKELDETDGWVEACADLGESEEEAAAPAVPEPADIKPAEPSGNGTEPRRAIPQRSIFRATRDE
jgi:hypothetical protein